MTSENKLFIYNSRKRKHDLEIRQTEAVDVVLEYNHLIPEFVI